MKKFLKLFFIGFLICAVLYTKIEVFAEVDDTPEATAVKDITEIQRSEEYIAKDCPDSGNPNLISICGSVRQATAQWEELIDGTTAPLVAQVPVKGVSVYLYECDNESPTCKQEGLVVNPFSSTTTNESGRFHLVARKLDNSWEKSYNYCDDDCLAVLKEENVEMIAQSKKKYLIFRCGKNFQGIHVIPSYKDLTDIIHEVNCPFEYSEDTPAELTYFPPITRFDFIGNTKLSNQMGIDDANYPDQVTDNPNEGYHMAAEAVYEEYATKKKQSLQITLKGADPRFTAPEPGSDKEEAMKAILGDPLTLVPTLGAWYSADCYKKYEGTDWVHFCNSNVEDYEKKLIDDPDYVVQHLLPNIPPKYSLLYYRPLEVRIDISGYSQDHDDIAKLLGFEFSNCVGNIYKRKYGEDPTNEQKPQYPDCETLKECNQTITYGDVNSHTSNGPALGLSDPNQLTKLEEIMDPEIPVCLVEGNDVPVKVGQIQKPGEPCREDMILCNEGSYWNSYYLVYLGGNNLTAKIGYAGEVRDDSYYKPLSGKLNEIPMQTGKEGEDVAQAGGISPTSFSDWSGSQSIGGVKNVIGAGSNMENTTNFVGQPYEDDKTKKELSDGISYFVSTRPVALGQFSNTNENEEQVISTSADDEDVLDDFFFCPDGKCMSNDNHYHGQDLTSQIEIKGGEEGGTRTPASGIYVTSPAKLRTTELGKKSIWFWDWVDDFRYDVLDSAISISVGHGYIDWKMTKVKGAPTGVSGFIQMLTKLFEFIRTKNGEKTFADRKPDGLGDTPDIMDSLVVTGYEVNECNFTTLFPCPGGGWPASWGNDGGSGCYPWHALSDGETCNTAKCDNGRSRTCKVNVCDKGVVNFEYKCTSPYNPEVISREVIKTGDCSAVDACAIGQQNWGTRPEQSPPVDVCGLFSYGDNVYTYTSKYDYCTVSVAGPNECDGDLEKTASVSAEQQFVRPDGNLDQINVDPVFEAGQKMYKGFRDPYTEDITVQPGAWISLTNSVSDYENFGSIRKDIPGIGIGTSFLTRAQFGPPSAFGASQQLEPLYIHCDNDDLQTEGEVECQFETLPDPEILEISKLEEELDNVKSNNCNLNASATCESLVLGEGLHFSDTFKLIMNLAGNTFQIEPAALLAYMARIGTTTKYAEDYWSVEAEDTLKKASLPWYGGFDFCDDLEPVAQHPYDWILLWFSRAIVADNSVYKPTMPSVKNALAGISPGRERTLSRCNFLDATYVTAHTISRNIEGGCGGGQRWGDYKTNGTVTKALNLMLFGGNPKGVNAGGGGLSQYEAIYNACR